MYSSSFTDIGMTEEKDDNLPCVGEFMYILYQKQRFTDVTFLLSKGQKTISAHRAVLAAKCRFFEELLFGSKINENDLAAKRMEMRVKISSVPFDVFCNIIEYFYTDEIDFEDDSTVMDILTGAKQFQIQSLVERCEAYIESIDLTADNVCSILQISDAKNSKVLKERCIKYIEENTDKVIGSIDFDKCTYNTIHKICNLETFNLSNEVQLLDSIVRWIKLQPSHTQSELKTSLLSCVRFLTLTARDFGNAIMKKFEDFLDAKDALKIMVFLNDSTAEDIESLPIWCNRSIVQRCSIEGMGARERNAQPRNSQPGKVIVPLKQCAGAQNVTELTSVLEMKCINGFHQIDAIKLSFQGPVNDTFAIKSLTIFVARFPNEFRHRENINLCNSSSVLIPFSKIINVRKGDILNIKAVARNIHFYEFLQFDEVCEVSPNPNFECCIQSHPRINRLFFISEIEYSPQIPLHLRNIVKKDDGKSKNF